MKYLVASILIISFMSLGVFGFAFFGHDMLDENKGCVAKTLGGMDCPLNVFDFALHHTYAFKTFSSVLPGSWAYLLSLILFSLIFSVSSALVFYKNFLSPPVKFWRAKRRRLVLKFSRLKTASWLSLLENSPSF